MKVAQPCPTLGNPMDYSPPGSSVHGISQERTLEWVAISFSRGSSQPWDQTCISCLSGRFRLNFLNLHFRQIQAKSPGKPLQLYYQLKHDERKLSILKQHIFIISHNCCQQSGNSLARSFWLKRSQGVAVKLSARAASLWGVIWWADHN